MAKEIEEISQGKKKIQEDKEIEKHKNKEMRINPPKSHYTNRNSRKERRYNQTRNQKKKCASTFPRTEDMRIEVGFDKHISSFAFLAHYLLKKTSNEVYSRYCWTIKTAEHN